eukprot:scaffold14697_cov124-Cylindrotheca_fusiformis.AAC.6
MTISQSDQNAADDYSRDAPQELGMRERRTCATSSKNTVTRKCVGLCHDPHPTHLLSSVVVNTRE